MNNKLLLVNAITLLYRESQLDNISENSTLLVRDVVNTVKLPELMIGIEHDREILEGLRDTALSMCSNPTDHSYTSNEMLQRLKVNCADDNTLYEAFKDGISSELTDKQLKKTCLNLRRTLNEFFREEKIKEIVNLASNTLRFNKAKITNIKDFVAGLVTSLEPYQIDTEKKDPAIISDVDTNNTDAVAEVFKTINDETSGIGLLRTGWQGLNKVLQGGFRRSESWVINALQHNWKTGFSLSIFRQMAMYNKPVLTDSTKIPMMLRISFEDSPALIFKAMYCSLKKMETGLNPDLTNVTDREMATYVQLKLAVNGYHTRFMYVNPSMWTYKDICNKIIELESEGYEIHMCMVDYLMKIPTTGCDQGASGIDLRNLYERIRNFMASKNILFITPHQLSTEAKMLIRNGASDNFVRDLVGKGYYAGCKQIDQVVDGELFIHIVELNGKSYLTIQRGKHRIGSQLPYEEKYIVYEFDDVGISDDVMTGNQTRRKVGGGVIGSADEVPFWGEMDY